MRFEIDLVFAAAALLITGAVGFTLAGLFLGACALADLVPWVLIALFIYGLCWFDIQEGKK